MALLPMLLELEVKNLVESGHSHPLLIVDKLGLESFSQVARTQNIPLRQVLCELDTLVCKLEADTAQKRDP